MIIDDSVKLYNFNKLLSIYSEILKANSHTRLGSKTEEVVNEISIGMKLKKLNFIEFLTLKSIVPDIRIISVGFREDCSPHESADEIFSVLLKLHQDIASNTKLGNSASVLPMTILTIDVEFIIKGQSILFLTNGTLDDLMLTGLDVSNYEIDETKIIERITRSFPKLLYNYMMRILGKSDFASEVIENNLVYDYLDTKKHTSVIPIRVVGSNDIIQLSGGNNDEVLRALKNMKSTNTLKNATIELAIYSNFWVFAKFIMYSDYVTNYIPLRNVLGSDKFGFDGELLKSYQARIMNVIRKFMVERHKMLENPDMELIKYLWILCSDKIKYKLSIPLSEIQNLNDKVFGDDSTGIVIKEIIRVTKPFI